ncbi:MAG TPA: FadR/GntR family transcriptional regulator [Thermodesulfobacteriota bacterium]|nr:FadR/GntR family transcriptional regulator [Thermodesulfobacteriota bacterium]
MIKNLLSQIMKGVIQPGDKLPATERLAKEMGTSILSAREAIQSLAGIGLVEISHGRGIFLTRGAPVIEELFETRKIIESHNAAMAAKNINPDGLKVIETLLDRMDRELEAGDIEAFSESDYEFHHAIGEAAGNRILFKTLENIKDLLRYQQSMINHLPQIIRRSAVHHRDIFNAIKKGDAQAAGAIMTGHIVEVIESWKKNFSPLDPKKENKNRKQTATGPKERNQTGFARRKTKTVTKRRTNG